MNTKDFYKANKLTVKQKEILTRLNNGEELTYSKNGGWWISEDRTNGRLAYKLLRHCAISADQCNKDDYQIYTINETGQMFLETGHLWIHKKFTNSFMFK